MQDQQRQALREACASEDGQTLTEYALILALLVILVVGGVTLFGHQLHDLFSTIGSGVQQAIP